MASPDHGLSVYVHVPFCTDKCLYCDFFSVPRHTVAPGIPGRVVEEMLLQAETALGALGAGGKVETIFVGGGTPSALSRPHLKRLLEFFAPFQAAEWTVEANPESVDEAFLGICREAGVTRLSIGVQSLEDAHLRFLRRPATREATFQALDLVKRSWRGELNLDFIAGIPGQTRGEICDDLAILERFRPHHVSLYQLTNESGTLLADLVERGSVALNPPEKDEELWFAGREELVRRGYRHYEISNFCLPGRECRHNLRYWRLEPYLGVGPAAVSTLPGAQVAAFLPGSWREGRIPAVARLTNPKDIPAYLRGKDSRWGMEVEEVTAHDFLLENVMMGLRLEEGIARATFRSRFGHEFDELFPGLWSRWEGRGYAAPPANRLRLTEGGRMLLDGLLEEAIDAAGSFPAVKLDVRWP